MSYQALARKYRPQSFHDVIGQETVVRTLQNAIKENRVQHGYLFSGVRGVGKTTSARILAKALNCIKGPALEPCNECSMCREITEGVDLDVREIDAATYTGVDNVRELRDVTQFQPARDRYRIFIIDEAHMLSTASWNALLKLIEEPPPHVVFMFATTEIHKVPQTILSRVQKFMLRKITLDELIDRLAKICEMEEIQADRAALEIIARRGEGSVRDSLSLLDQIIAFSGRSITPVEVATVLGLSDVSLFARLIGYIAEGDHAAILEAVAEAAESGRDFKMLYRDFLSFVRNLLLVAGGANRSILAASPEELATIDATAARFSYTDVLRIANVLLRDDETVNRAEHQRLAVELALLKAATFPRLKAVEEAVGGGVSAAPSRPATPRPEPAARVAPTPRPATRPAPEPERESAPPSRGSGSGDGAALIDKVQSSRPLIGSYLAGSKSSVREGSKLTFLFAPADSFFAEQLADHAKTLEELAAQVYGEPLKIAFEIERAGSPAAGRRAEDQPSPVKEDPIVKAFARHLGGEVIEPRKR